MTNILEKIVADKRDEIIQRKKSHPLSTFVNNLQPSSVSFYDALAKPTTSFILECKKASPSKGLIRPEFNLNEICSVYKNYADCISVLTDEKYFQGSFENLQKVRALVSQPIICKDFFIDEYQVYLARHVGADAVLLMLSVLKDAEYKQLAELASSLNMDVLTEVSNEEEVERAINLNARIIGINNRNLRDLSTNLATTFKLAELIPKDRLIISESGIYTHRQVKTLSNVANGFLVGSSLMAEPNLDVACKKLIWGENKVCGLARIVDARAAYMAGAVYGGLICYPKSPRYVDLDCAKAITQTVPLEYVGVFVNEPTHNVLKIVNALNLAAVQLHGDESSGYIQTLKETLPETCKIFKAHAISNTSATINELADRTLFDTKAIKGEGVSGGTGRQFNWALLSHLSLDDNFILAGGINPNVIDEALNIAANGLDINSGVEVSPGKKDLLKINQIFEKIKHY
ncbi:bifunctional indole-3-glycerol-phosphate synthase TrpC/phosphoribosylanthranilate isomerase TrpF [Flocculibacter collagenilyticus]|uniref:bifunctional indole-3-glycerol-phosphate synthase TrpC/phosphoribosylanthranilate isomerase TrpF n=1 Tax=Flocculibacter collagenilyticus TaxID=2744479 RepID=UPI0018F62A17|nr:bifunctional indole-3-glycerol-phosphate synthase TrpC/phosphoribosylanthranilate isomerase TrpF [Flocculibacter collagenilyticus]